MKKLLLLIFACFLFSCSQNDSDKLIGKWDFEKIESKSKIEEVYDQSQQQLDFENLMYKFLENNYLFFENKETFNAVLGANNGIYVKGNWSYNPVDSIIPLTSGNGKLYLKIISIGFDELKCSITGLKDFNSKDMVVVFQKRGEKLTSSKYNFTQPKFNSWRERPKNSEDINQIMARVRNCLAYSIAYLKYNQDVKSNSVSTTNISLPFNFYGNGLSLEDFEKANNFRNMFFNEGDALIAYNLIKGVMREQLNLPEGKSSLEINTIILEHIYKRIK